MLHEEIEQYIVRGYSLVGVDLVATPEEGNFRLPLAVLVNILVDE